MGWVFHSPFVYYKMLGTQHYCGNAENLCHKNNFTFTLHDRGGVSQLTAEEKRI